MLYLGEWNVEAMGKCQASQNSVPSEVSTAAIVIGDYFYHRKGGNQHIPEICSFPEFFPRELVAGSQPAMHCWGPEPLRAAEEGVGLV